MNINGIISFFVRGFWFRIGKQREYWITSPVKVKIGQIAENGGRIQTKFEIKKSKFWLHFAPLSFDPKCLNNSNMLNFLWSYIKLSWIPYVEGGRRLLLYTFIFDITLVFWSHTPITVQTPKPLGVVFDTEVWWWVSMSTFIRLFGKHCIILQYISK